jgi:hypothetical protein
MSHFIVAVFTKEGQTVEELLAPYQENNMGDCPKEYLEFYDVEEEYRNKYENEGIEKVKLPDGRLLSSWESGAREYENLEKVKVPFKETYETFEQFMEEWAGYKKDEETGKYGYWENPNAKWDWWVVGGRWSGLLKLKDEATTGQMGDRRWTNINENIPKGRVDSAKVRDIDFSIDMDEYNRNLRFWELVVEGDTPRNVEEEEIVKWSFYYNPEYYLNRYDSKEEYARLCSEFDAYAVITPDGKWHSKGEMGWWGISSESHEEAKKWNKSFKEAFIDNADPEWTLTIVDCHI